jgi:hypothetical protein
LHYNNGHCTPGRNGSFFVELLMYITSWNFTRGVCSWFQRNWKVVKVTENCCSPDIRQVSLLPAQYPSVLEFCNLSLQCVIKFKLKKHYFLCCGIYCECPCHHCWNCKTSSKHVLFIELFWPIRIFMLKKKLLKFCNLLNKYLV